jgi:hypothetical protein
MAIAVSPLWISYTIFARRKAAGAPRKLAVILHRMWIEGTEFNWSSKEAASQPA